MRVPLLLHSVTENTFTRKTGEKVTEPLFMVTDSSEGARMVQFLELRGEKNCPKDWKAGQVRVVDITELKQNFSGRLQVLNCQIQPAGK